MNAPSQFKLDPSFWMQQALKILALKLRHEVALMRVLRGPDRQEGFLGLFLNDQEVQAMLGELSGLLQVEGAAPTEAEIDTMMADLTRVRQSDPNCIWSKLAQRFQLTDAELDILLLCAAPCLDPRFGRVYAYLNDDMGRKYLTPALLQKLLSQHQLDLPAIRSMLSSHAPLSVNGIIHIEESRPFCESGLHLDEAVVDWLIDAKLIQSCKFEHASVVQSPSSNGSPISEIIFASSHTGQDPGLVALNVAGRHKLPLLWIDYEELENLKPDRVIDILRRYLRDAQIIDYIPYLTGFEKAPKALAKIISKLIAPPCVIEASNSLYWTQFGIAGVEIDISEIDRKSTLSKLVESYPTLSDSTKKLVFSTQNISIVETARLLQEFQTETGLYSALKVRMSKALENIALPIVSPFELDDIILTPKTRHALESVISWHDHRDTVLNKWGLGENLNKKPGITVLFKGPSGTGKTMAASIVANMLDFPIYRVDLSAMISKYIGETEKNLNILFKAAEKSDVIIFFDEADAIFGQRSEVNDSHDRYANVETSYLLQRLEAFNGTSILATNFHQNIDEAFLRRIDFSIDFPAPGYSERLQIWQRLERTSAPLSPDVCFETLANNFDLTGGEIRNCILDAAHRASRQDMAIGMMHFMRSVSRELTKQNRPVQKSGFGTFYNELEDVSVCQ